MPPQQPSQKPRDALMVIQSEIQTLDSKINLLQQQVKTMEKNQEIIGMTLIALNEKIEKVSKDVSFGGSGKRESIDSTKFATKQEIEEIKALLNTFNPLEYATIDQVKELLEETAKKTEKKKF